jgi:excisionase family DNA binding protein
MNSSSDTAGVMRVQGGVHRDTHESNRGVYSEQTTSETTTNCGTRDDALPGQLGNRMSVEEIARRLDIGRLAVYAMLEQGLLPGIRLGRRVDRHTACVRGVGADVRRAGDRSDVWTTNTTRGMLLTNARLQVQKRIRDRLVLLV